MSQSESRLSETHQLLIEQSAISEEVAKLRGYRTICSNPELRDLGFGKLQQSAPGLLVPVHRLGQSEMLYQFRPDQPRTVDGKTVKYETPKGSKMGLDVHPLIREMLGDPNKPLFVTEGIRKADAAISAGLCCIGLLGVWNWRGTNGFGGKVALPEWDSIALNGRTVCIAFDSDSKTNSHVRKATCRLARFLKSRGAKVFVIELSPNYDGSKVGLDDFFAAGGRCDQLLGLAATLQAFEANEEIPDRKPSTAAICLELLASLELFHTADGDAYAKSKRGDHSEVHRLCSGSFESYVRQQFYSANRLPLPRAALEECIATLEARARYEGSEQRVFIRIAHANDRIYVDIGDESWTSIEISADGWRTCEVCPVHFQRSNDMLALPMPVSGGTIDNLRPFINAIADEDFVLIVAFIVGAYMNPDYVTFALLVLIGEMGSAKSTTAKVLQRIVDPRKTELCRFGGVDDVLLAASRRRLLALDNLGKLSQSQSDLLCNLVTGGGISRRKLYSDSDEICIDAKLPLILTGIGDIVSALDLADRCLFPKLRHISDGARKTEAEFWNEFANQLPLILGWLFDTVSVALRNAASLMSSRSPRLADFYHWALAADKKFGRYQGTFETAMWSNSEFSNSQAVEDSALAQLMIRWLTNQAELESKTVHRITATDLRNALLNEAIGDEKREVPTATSLRSQLRKLSGALRSIGIIVNVDAPRTESGRWIHINGVDSIGVIPVIPVIPSFDNGPPHDEPSCGNDNHSNANDTLPAVELNSEMTDDSNDDGPGGLMWKEVSVLKGVD